MHLVGLVHRVKPELAPLRDLRAEVDSAVRVRAQAACDPVADHQPDAEGAA